MKKINMIFSFSVGAIILLSTGCANPSFNTNDKKIVFADGIPFRVPVGASHAPHVYTTSVGDKEKISVYKKNGLNCKLGDILWIEKGTIREATSVLKKSGKIAGYTYVAQAARLNKAGCVSPLSDREYDYYKQADSERLARQHAARMQIARNIGNSTPKTYNVNVNHSGNINQNLNVNHSGYINTQ